MRRTIVLLIFAAAIAIPCLAQSTDPVGPAGWTMRNWIGFCIQITVFILAVIGVCKLAKLGK